MQHIHSTAKKTESHNNNNNNNNNKRIGLQSVPASTNQIVQ